METRRLVPIQVDGWSLGCWFQVGLRAAGSKLVSGLLVPSWSLGCWFQVGLWAAGSKLVSGLLVPSWSLGYCMKVLFTSSAVYRASQ